MTREEHLSKAYLAWTASADLNRPTDDLLEGAFLAGADAQRELDRPTVFVVTPFTEIANPDANVVVGLQVADSPSVPMKNYVAEYKPARGVCNKEFANECFCALPAGHAGPCDLRYDPANFDLGGEGG